MRVRVPLMIQDPLTSRYRGMRLTEGFFIDREDIFLDGPVSRRVAVLDFDPSNGQLQPGARFVPPAAGRVLGRYAIANESAIYAPDFIQASVFGTVLKTMYMFEAPDTLGRRLSWAFPAPQLLVVPRAGWMANAFYERESHSLQFFVFEAGVGGPPIYTALSRDIVAHETGHAILDGIAPDLYHALTPQSLALHEAVADLTALLMSFLSHTLRRVALAQTGGSIRNSTAFSSVAEEFGRALDPSGRAGNLRSLMNERTLDPAETRLDADGRPRRVPDAEPHALSEVLSGALYAMAVGLFEKLQRRYAREADRPPAQVAERALAVAALRFKSMIFRALDYLPPGEVSFGDYGRAILAADQAAFPGEDEERAVIRQEFVRRRMVARTEDLQVETHIDVPALHALDLETLVESDWVAYEFANQQRELLGIPAGIPFWVRPRLDVTKLYFTRAGRQEIRECLFKVSWHVQEPNALGWPFARRRQITAGSTLAIDWETRRVRARLLARPAGEQCAARDALLRRLWGDDLLALGAQPAGGAHVERMGDDLLRVRGTGRLLHVL